MKNFIVICTAFLFASCGQGEKILDKQHPEVKTPVIVIHGGAGHITSEAIPPEMQKLYEAALNRVLDSAYARLKRGDAAIDVVSYAVSLLEDDSLFNAGKGAVLTEEGKAELDASIMDGLTGKAGAVAGLTHIKNPIQLARQVMDKSPHVFLIGAGAEKLGFSLGMDSVSNDYFITSKMRQRFESQSPHGTVGAVAIDVNGNIAAATSTGGMWGKKFGRVGDVPVIGAGTYASNNTCGVSCTGWGEYFIRNTAASQIHYRILFGNEPLDSAVRHTLEQIGSQGGDGGIIAVDKYGNYTLQFNSKGMFRGAINADGKKEVGMFR